MVNMTLSVPEELHQKLARHPEFKWSEVVRQALEQKLKEVELMESIVARSKLTEEDAERIGHKLKAEIRKRFT